VYAAHSDRIRAHSPFCYVTPLRFCHHPPSSHGNDTNGQEEDDTLPALLVSHFSPAEIESLTDKIVRFLPLGHVPVELGWMVSSLSPYEKAWMLARLPPPMRYKLTHQWLKRQARLRQAFDSIYDHSIQPPTGGIGPAPSWCC
jgi:hypothetical protein